MSRYLTSTHEIADALQSIVDDLRAMPNDDLTPLAVHVKLQAVQHAGTPEERMRTVDVLGWHLSGATGERIAETRGLYGTPYSARSRDGVSVDVFTNPQQPESGRR